MKKMKKILLSASILLVFLAGYNSTFAQNKLVTISPSAVYDNAFSGKTEAQLFEIPVHDNALQSILNELKSKKYAELHIYALTEANMIGFHTIALSAKSLNKHSALLKQFQAYKLKIVVHSKVLGTTVDGQKFLTELSKLMGNKVEVQK